MVDIQFESAFEHPIPLKELRGVPALENMILLRRGHRLSVIPVTKKAYQAIVKLTDSIYNT